MFRDVGMITSVTTPVGSGPVLGEPTGVVVSNSAFATGNRLGSSNDAPNVTNALCAGARSDPDMIAIEAGTVADEYAAIEFDVMPQFDILAIPFQFGSDEFPEYVCSNFGDLVSIYVRGAGITGPYSGALQAENYAKTAGGDLSSINWVNTGTVGQNGNLANCGSLANVAFYSDNSNGSETGGSVAAALTNANLEMDGFTNTVFQPISIVAGQTYHAKIAVADSADRIYDSTAFIHPLFSTGTFSGFDYGDATDSNGTLTSNGDPNHAIDNAIFMGAAAPDSVDNSLGAPNLTRDSTNIIANTSTGNIGGGATFTLNQGIVFVAPFTFSVGNSVNAQLLMLRANGGARTVQVQLFNGNSGAQIGAPNSVIWNVKG